MPLLLCVGLCHWSIESEEEDFKKGRTLYLNKLSIIIALLRFIFFCLFVFILLLLVFLFFVFCFALKCFSLCERSGSWVFCFVCVIWKWLHTSIKQCRVRQINVFLKVFHFNLFPLRVTVRSRLASISFIVVNFLPPVNFLFRISIFFMKSSSFNFEL